MSNGPAKIIPAATILLLRNSPDGLEVFMVVRHHQIDFASGALVFPGGKADPSDFDPALASLIDGAATDTQMRAIQVSGIRESFEECGVLLARADNGGNAQAGLVSAEDVQALEPYRKALNDGDLSIADFLQQQALRLACDELVHFAHWITPEMMPKRFDTHFFLVAAPEDQLAIHDGYESVDSIWIRPSDAIAEAASGERTIIFPTLRNLEKLAHYNTVADALAASRRAEIVTVLPWTEKREDGVYLCIPENAGYSLSEEKMPERRP